MEKLSSKFSVVIAAKNEAHNLEALLNCFSELKYSPDDFEIIIVDDSSTDNTAELLNKVKNKYGYTIKVICADEKKYPAKKGALDRGINEADFEYILITDADCRPSRNWLSVYKEYFAKGYDFLFGPAPFYNDDNLINSISCFENLRSTLLTSFFAKIGFPYSASARNFGFKKSSFIKSGGYTNTLDALGGDDDLLLREAVKHKMKIGYIGKKEASVFSFTKNTIGSYLTQKKRHTKTSIHYLPVNQMLLALWHLLNLFLLFAPVILFGTVTGVSLFLIKIIVDILIVKGYEHKLNYNFNILSVPALQIIYELFIVVNFINALTGKDEWK